MFLSQNSALLSCCLTVLVSLKQVTRLCSLEPLIALNDSLVCVQCSASPKEGGISQRSLTEYLTSAAKILYCSVA